MCICASICVYVCVYVCTVQGAERSRQVSSRSAFRNDKAYFKLFVVTRHISTLGNCVCFFHDNAYFCFSSWHFSPLGHWRKADLPDTGLLMLMPCDNKNLLVGQWDHFQIVHMNTQCVALVLLHRTGRIVPKKAITQIRSICYDLVINSVLQNCLTFEHCAVQKANWIWH